MKLKGEPDNATTESERQAFQHSTIVRAVKDTTRSGGVMDDYWRDFVRDYGTNNIHDPARYSHKFLARFITEAFDRGDTDENSQFLDWKKSFGLRNVRGEPASKRFRGDVGKVNVKEILVHDCQSLSS